MSTRRSLGPLWWLPHIAAIAVVIGSPLVFGKDAAVWVATHIAALYAVLSLIGNLRLPGL